MTSDRITGFRHYTKRRLRITFHHPQHRRYPIRNFQRLQFRRRISTLVRRRPTHYVAYFGFVGSLPLPTLRRRQRRRYTQRVIRRRLGSYQTIKLGCQVSHLGGMFTQRQVGYRRGLPFTLHIFLLRAANSVAARIVTLRHRK